MITRTPARISTGTRFSHQGVPRAMTYKLPDPTHQTFTAQLSGIKGVELQFDIEQHVYTGSVEPRLTITFIHDGTVIGAYCPWRDDFDAMGIVLYQLKYNRLFPFVPVPGAEAEAASV